MEIQTYTREASLTGVINTLAGQLMPSSRSKYRAEIRHFQAWLYSRGIEDPRMASREDLAAWHEYVSSGISAKTGASFAPATAKRKWTVICRLYQEAYYAGLIGNDPAEHMRGFRVDNDYSPHIAISVDQFKLILASINVDDQHGLRDYALLLLLGKAGLRREEVTKLTVGSLGSERGYWFYNVIGKGNKIARVKLREDVKYAIDMYLESRGALTNSDPLFVSQKGGKLSANAIWLIVRKRSAILNLPKPLSPHDMRATFATLALQLGAPLHSVQDAMRHADSRTTQRYNKRRNALEDNAVDVLRF